jgi:hypothetical protein
MDPDVERALSHWISVANGRGICVSGPVLESKSRKLTKKLDHNDLKATDGWLSQWKCMLGIKFKKTHGEKCSA